MHRACVERKYAFRVARFQKALGSQVGRVPVNDWHDNVHGKLLLKCFCVGYTSLLQDTRDIVLASVPVQRDRSCRNFHLDHEWPGCELVNHHKTLVK